MSENEKKEDDNKGEEAADLLMLAKQSTAIEKDVAVSSKQLGQEMYYKCLQTDNKALTDENKKLKKTIEVYKHRLAEMGEVEQPKELEDLIRENQELKIKLRKGGKLQKQRKLMNPQANESDALMVDQSTFIDFQFTHGGLSRYNLVNDKWHKRNPSAANQLFGFKTWYGAKEFLKEKFPDLEIEEPQIYRTAAGSLEMMDVLEIEKCLCIKMMDRMAMTKGRVALLYGVDTRTVTRWRGVWCPKWGFERSVGGHHTNTNLGTNYFQSKPMVYDGPRKKRAKTDEAGAGDEECDASKNPAPTFQIVTPTMPAPPNLPAIQTDRKSVV